MDESRPFEIDRRSGTSLTSQVADGLRSSIVTGRYPAGSCLPTLTRLSADLGVSMNTVRAAFRQLSDEGLIVSRTGVGSIVQPLGRRGRRGHVLLVFPESKSSFYLSVMSYHLRNVLMKEGFFVNEVVVPMDANRRHVLDILELQLSKSVDLAIQIQRTPAIRRVLVDSGIPFVASDFDCASTILARNCVCHICVHLDGGADELLCHCRESGVSSVFMACAWSQCDALAQLFRGAGVSVVARQFCTAEHYGQQEAVQRAGMEALQHIIAEEPHLLSGLLMFPDDDVFASGALMALTYAGWRIPEDVKVVTLSNKGSGPVYPKTLARLEVDVEAFSDCVAENALAFLNRKDSPLRVDLETRYIKGDSFP
ncbi:MAG: GntR family transcriptional regulator [Kiritimatiellae bacterium]|nr:GntR family transcriptional regulator [Kiritimatiellia bacterium]MBQ3344366.1 GntR family transcriptional regulator [Kiritimatiellia bacterium]